MGYKMNISSLRKAFIFMGAVAALSLVNAQSALAANESAKDMTCQEFIDLNKPYSGEKQIVYLLNAQGDPERKAIFSGAGTVI